ncbi:hypothetical protein OG809_18095 [Kribbella soli]
MEVVVGFGVAVWLGFVVGLDVVLVGFGVGVRELSRLGAVVDRVGFGVGVFVVARVGVGVGVELGVYDGVVGRLGVAFGASSPAGATDVIGFAWLVGLLLPV